MHEVDDAPVARQITRRIREVAKTWPAGEIRKAAFMVADLIAAEFDPGHIDGAPPWKQPR